MASDRHDKLAILALTEPGVALGRDLRKGLRGAELFVPARFAATAPEGVPFEEPLARWVAELWAQADGFVFIMAAGIVVRTVAPLLRGKALDPAVVVMDEAGRFAVSLLSGHLGGANQLAEEAATLVGGTAVITTATDVRGLPAWDEVARKAGLAIEPVANIRYLNTLLLEGKPIVLVDRRERITPYYAGLPAVQRVATFSEAMRQPQAGKVFVTHRLIPRLEENADLLVLRPKDLIVGLGCNRGTSSAEIEAVVEEELKRAFLSPASIAGLATVEAKVDEAGLLEFAERRKFPIHFHSAAALNAVEVPGETSSHALAAVGAKGVCEPAALLSAGGPLLVTKKKRGNVTVAVAEKVGASLFSGERPTIGHTGATATAEP